MAATSMLTRVRLQLDRGWRCCATGFAFALMFGGGLLLAVTVVPLLRMCSRNASDSGRRVRWTIRLTFSWYLWLLKSLGLIELRVSGQDRLDSNRGRIIVANHPTLLDVVILLSLLRNARCIVKDELWQNPWLGRVIRAAGYVSNGLQGEEMLAACREVFEQHDDLVIFPEGTRSQPGRPMRFLRGFANLSLLEGADIQPVVIRCDPPTLMKGDPWWAIPPRKPVFEVSVGGCLDTTHQTGYEHRAVAARVIVRKMEQYYADCLNAR